MVVGRFQHCVKNSQEEKEQGQGSQGGGCRVQPEDNKVLGLVERTSQVFTLMKLRLKEATESVKLGGWGQSPVCFVLSGMVGGSPGKPRGKPQDRASGR